MTEDTGRNGSVDSHLVGHRRRMRGGVTAVTVAAISTAVFLGGGARAQGTPGRTIVLKELDRGSTYKQIHNTRGASPRSNLVGDILVLARPIADAGGNIVGRFHGTCITTLGSRTAGKATGSCSAIIELPDGEIYGQFLLRLKSNTTTGVVTGGTGAYDNARGTVVAEEGRDGAVDTITLVS